jgi:hypothetical protein
MNSPAKRSSSRPRLALKAGREAPYHRARCNGAASSGTYTDEMGEK